MLSGLSAAIFVVLITFLFVRPKYSAAVTLCANNSSSTDINTSISSQDINAPVQLVDTYAAIILSDPVLDKVIEINALDICEKELLDAFEITSVNNAEVSKVVVTYPTSEMASDIANSIADISPIKIAEIM